MIAKDSKDHNIAYLSRAKYYAIFLLKILVAYLQPMAMCGARRFAARAINSSGVSSAHKYGYLRRTLWQIRKANVWILAAVPITSFVAVWLVGERLDGLLPQCDPQTSNQFCAFDLGHFRDLLVGFLGAQAALVALVFPLVIAVISILFEARTTTGNRLSAYFQECEAVMVGASGLALCMILSVQISIAHQLTRPTAVLFLTLNAIWFLTNLCAIAFFLFRSLMYVQPETRQTLIKKFILNTAWRIELEAEYISNILDRLPQGGQFNSMNSPRYFVGPASMYWISDFESIQAKPWTRVSDISPKVIQLVGSLWVWRTQRLQAPQASEKPNGAAYLVLPLVPDEKSHANQKLVCFSKGYPPSRLELFLINRAYKFKRHSLALPIPSTYELLKEAVGELIQLYDSRRPNEFEARMNEVIDLHSFLFEISNLGRENSQNDEEVAARIDAITQDWARCYRDLFSRVVALDAGAEFLAGASRSLSLLYSRSVRHIAADHLGSINLLASNLIWNFLSWANKQNAASRKQGDAATSKEGFLLDEPQGAAYGRAWVRLVSDWEYLLGSYLRVDEDRQSNKWGLYSSHAKLIAQHLENTAVACFIAALNGDRTAISWTTDMLLRWNGGFDRSAEWAESFRFRSNYKVSLAAIFERLQPTYFQRDPEAVASEISPAEFINDVMVGAWQDYLVTLVCMLLRHLPSGETQSAVGRSVGALISNERYDTASTQDWPSPFHGPISILAIVIRLAVAGGRFDGKYYKIISKFIERAGQLTEREWVSNRIYMSTGMNDLDELRFEHALLLVLVTPPTKSEGVFVAQIDRVLSEMGSWDAVVINSIKSALVQLREVLKNADKLKPLIRHILGDRSSDEIEMKLAGAGEFLDSFILKIENQTKSRIRDMRIDPERLSQLSGYCSKLAFNKQTAEFPINLFGQISLDNEVSGRRFTLIDEDYERGLLTHPLMAIPVSNEESYWAFQVKRVAANFAWRTMLSTIPFIEVACGDAADWWNNVKSIASRMRKEGDTPILVCSHSRSNIEWLESWTWSDGDRESPRPADFTIGRDLSIGAESYRFSVNGMPVFAAASEIGCSYIIPSGAFQEVKFKKFANNNGALVEFEESTSNPLSGKLKVSIELRLQLSQKPVYRLRMAPK